MSAPCKPLAPGVIAMDARAFARGFVAGNRGDKEDCPYPPLSRAAWSWSVGRIEGQAYPRPALPRRGRKAQAG